MGKRKCDRKEGGAMDAMFPPRRPLQDQEAMECSDLDRLHGSEGATRVRGKGLVQTMHLFE